MCVCEGEARGINVEEEMIQWTCAADEPARRASKHIMVQRDLSVTPGLLFWGFFP